MPIYEIVYLVLIGAGFLVGVIRWKKMAKSSRWAVLLLAATLISEIFASYWAKHYRNNLWVFHCLSPVQFVLITYCFWEELKLKIQKISIYVVPVLFIGISTFIQSGQFPSYPITISFVFFVAWSLFYFRALLLKASDDSVLAYPLFWISCGWLQFCVVNLFPFGLFNSFFQDNINELNAIFRNIRIGSNLVLYSCYLVAVLSPQKRLQ